MTEETTFTPAEQLLINPELRDRALDLIPAVVSNPQKLHFVVKVLELYDDHGNELFQNAFFKSAETIHAKLSDEKLFIGLEKEGNPSSENPTHRIARLDLKFFAKHINDPIAETIVTGGAAKFQSAPSNFLRTIETWIGIEETWGSLLAIDTNLPAEENIETHSNATHSIDAEKKDSLKGVMSIPLDEPLELSFKEYLLLQNKQWMTKRIANTQIPHLRNENKFKDSPSMLEITFDCICEELSNKGVDAESVADTRKALYSSFPRLEKIIQREEAIAARQEEKQAKTEAANSENEKPKTIPPFDLGSNTKYIVDTFKARSSSISEAAGIKSEKGKLLTPAEAREFAKSETTTSKNSGKDGLLVEGKASGDFLLSSYYANGIMAVKAAFDNRAEQLGKKLSQADTDSEKAELEGKLDRLNTIVRDELSGIIGETGKAKQATARLINQSDLSNDFPNIHPPKELKKPPSKLSMELTRLINDADATFLKAAAEDDNTSLKRNAEQNRDLSALHK